MGRLGLCLALVAVVVSTAFGDGGFVPRNVTLSQKGSSAAQKGVVVAEGESQVLLLETTYRGPASDFAWVIPVPATPQEVFPANAEFIDQIFRQTSAVQVDHFVRETPAPSAGANRGVGGGGDGEQQSSLASPARIVARMVVGDYDALVFSAGSTADGGPVGLAEWLQREGYTVSEQLASLLTEYAKKQWVFVALKLQGKVAQEKPLLQDVPPIGIRFPRHNERLVFPLLISRLSAPAFTSLSLVAISRTGYRCKELEVVRLNEERPISAGETYGAIRRDLCRRPRPALFCEYVAAHPAALSMSYRAGGGDPVQGDLGGRATVSRYFAYLKPEEMVDLNFTPFRSATLLGYVVLAERTGPMSLLSGEGKALQQAVDHFTEDCGVLPVQAQDLVSEPAFGQDASGNQVPIRGWLGPYLATKQEPHSWPPPVSLAHWVFDPLNIVFCDRAGLKGTARPATLQDCETAAREKR